MANLEENRFLGRSLPRWIMPGVIGALAAASIFSPAWAEVRAKQSPRSDVDVRRLALAQVKSWAIQLRYIDRQRIASSPFDLVVIDHAPHPQKDVELPFTASEIEPMQVQPSGKRRIVLAYLSIGEAEKYRYYWRPEWDEPAARPPWIGAENPRWPGDFFVKFSDPDWQAIIFGTPQSYLDKIVAAGFDGIYLDRADAYQDVEESVPGAEDAMTGFITRLADHAHRLNPHFLVVLQNAEELLRRRSVLQRIDAFAKEDLLFGARNNEETNPADMVRASVQYLRRAKRAGLKVFVLEYVTDPAKLAKAQELAAYEGFLTHVTERLLGTLSLVPPGEAQATPEQDPTKKQ